MGTTNSTSSIQDGSCPRMALACYTIITEICYLNGWCDTGISETIDPFKSRTYNRLDLNECLYISYDGTLEWMDELEPHAPDIKNPDRQVISTSKPPLLLSPTRRALTHGILASHS